MNAASMVTVPAIAVPHTWRGRIGILGLILAENSLFGVFVVTYLFYTGKSLSGPYPKDVLDVPVLATICLLSSSISVALSEKALRITVTVPVWPAGTPSARAVRA